MPELPEVETMRRGIQGIVGTRISEVVKPRSKYRPIQMSPSWPTFKRRLLNREIVSVDRIAKRVVVCLDSGDSLVMQPKMAGMVLLGEPPTQQHVRLEIELSNPIVGRLRYWDRRGLGTVHLWSPDEMDSQLGPGVLGPDAMNVSLAEFIHQISSTSREVKVALLDQRLVAGIGNLYAAEILHAAKVHPRTRCKSLSRHKWKRIHACTQSILTEAIQFEGSTLGDGTYRNAQNDPGGYQNHHRVYARENESCLSCMKTKIIRIVQAQRSTFYCPHCQRA